MNLKLQDGSCSKKYMKNARLQRLEVRVDPLKHNLSQQRCICSKESICLAQNNLLSEAKYIVDFQTSSVNNIAKLQHISQSS